ncbi:HTTM domain-containing protein [Bdellovibrio bacteriovorus]|uniref:HTTM domain-containing protein n=1 Tax=Bdellovibrio bacteriovorus TaxID=959 RepID=UPI003A7F9746
MKLTTLTSGLNEFFFKPQPVHTVALLRVLFGVVLLINWFMVWSHLDTFWGVEGIYSLESALKMGSAFRFSLFELLPPDPRVPALLALVHLGAVIGVLFGLFTRTSIAVAFFTLISFHNRNVFVLNSSDIVIRNFLFLLFLTPCGDWLSVDRWWQVRRGLAPAEPVDKAPWGLRLMQIQFSIIYIATVMFKMKGALWADGTAVYVATRLDEFVRMPLGLLNNLLVIKFLTWSTLAVELALGTLIWIRELRYWVLLAGVGLHLGIELSMNIPMFEWIMIITMLCMVDPKDMKDALTLAKEGRLFSSILSWRPQMLVKAK